MVSAFQESNLQYQKDCLIAKTYKSKSLFSSTVISIKCPFDQTSFRSSIVSIKCRFDQLSFRSIVVSIKCRFDQVSFDQLSLDQLS